MCPVFGGIPNHKFYYRNYRACNTTFTEIPESHQETYLHFVRCYIPAPTWKIFYENVISFISYGKSYIYEFVLSPLKRIRWRFTSFDKFTQTFFSCICCDSLIQTKTNYNSILDLFFNPCCEKK